MVKMVGMLVVMAMEAQNPRSVDAVVGAERAFAAEVAKRGIRDGFLAQMDDESMVFVPAPTPGKIAYGALKDSSGLILWEPKVAVISADGTLGFTTGPFRVPDPDDATKSRGEGYYTSVWKRSGDRWTMVFDCGAPMPSEGVKRFDVALLPTDGKSSEASLEKANADVASHLDSSSRFHFPATTIAVGEQNIREARAAVKGLVFKVTKSGIAGSGDFGWCYGEIEKDGKKGGFSRTWRFAGGRWRLVTEVVLPPR